MLDSYVTKFVTSHVISNEIYHRKMKERENLSLIHFSLIDFIWRHVWRHKFCHIWNKYWPFQLTTDWLNMWTTVTWRRPKGLILENSISSIFALWRLHMTVVHILSQLVVNWKDQYLLHMWQNLWRHTWRQIKSINEKWPINEIWAPSINWV